MQQVLRSRTEPRATTRMSHQGQAPPPLGGCSVQGRKVANVSHDVSRM